MDLQAKRNGVRMRCINSAFWDLVACALSYICLYYVKKNKQGAMHDFVSNRRKMDA